MANAGPILASVSFNPHSNCPVNHSKPINNANSIRYYNLNCDCSDKTHNLFLLAKLIQTATMVFYFLTVITNYDQHWYPHTWSHLWFQQPLNSCPTITDAASLVITVKLSLKYHNSIPLHIRQSQTYSSFRRHLKTHYFISAHLAP